MIYYRMTPGDAPTPAREDDRYDPSGGGSPASSSPSGTSPGSASPDPSAPGSGRPQKGRPAIPLVFVAIALVALAVVPLFVELEVARIQKEVVEVVEPARASLSDLRFAQARQTTALQAFLLTGQERFRVRYDEARGDERKAYESLERLAGRLDLPVRERLAALSSASQGWHLEHMAVLAGDPSGGDVGLPPAVQSGYEKVQAASLALEETLREEMESARARMDDARRMQTWITVVLVGLALAATLAVAAVAQRLQDLFEEARRRRSQALLARREVDAVLAATGDGILGIDPQGCCTFINRAGSDLLGYTTREVLDSDVHALLHHSRPDGSPYPREACPILGALEGGGTGRTFEETFWRRNRTSFPVQCTIRPLVDGRELKGIVLTFTDLTEIRKVESELRKAVQVRDEVVAVVSHDLKNPVGTIYAAADLLRAGILPPEAREEHLEIVVRAAERMDRLIRDLLDVARLEAGGLSVEPRPVAPGDVIEEARAMAEPVAGEKGLRLRSRVQEDLPTVRADRDRLLQVLSNLVGNSLKFTPEGGCVTLEARTGGDEVVFGVADTGRGIDEEARRHLFDRFWQMNRRDREGAGLGLAIVKGILDAHGSWIRVESEPGEGTTFLFGLPVAGPEGAPSSGETA